MNNRINLKDGFCVSCGLESGVLYHSCPFCDEMVWHPLWRRALLWYLAVILPIAVVSSLSLNSALLNSALRAYVEGGWQSQLLITLSAALLLLPYENPQLIYPSQRSRFLWMLNSLAALIILLLCALLFSVSLRFSNNSIVLRSLCCVVALTGLLVPLVLNCSWRLLIPLLFFTTGLTLL